MLVVFLLPANNLSKAPSAPFLSESVHIFMFAALIWFFVREQIKYNPGNMPVRRIYLLALILGLLFGIFIEFIQEISNLGRTAEIMDVIFDVAGILLSFGILQLASQIKIKKKIRD